MTERNAEISRLIGLTARYLKDELRPDLEGRHAFLTLVAANLLESLARDVSNGDAAERRAAERLGDLLGRPRDQASETDLCALIAQGVLDEQSPALMAHLRETVLDRLAIDQPTYEAYRRERPS